MKKIVIDTLGTILVILVLTIAAVAANYDSKTRTSTVIDVTVEQPEGTYYIGTSEHHLNVDSTRNLTVTVDIVKKSIILEITDEEKTTGIDFGHDMWNLLSGADLHRLFFEEWGNN